MKKRLTFVLAMALFCSAIPAKADSLTTVKKGRYLMKFREAFGSGRVQDFLEKEGLVLDRIFDEIGVYVVDAKDPVVFAKEGFGKVERSPEVMYIEPDHLWQADSVPNDPDYGQQKPLLRIEPEAAWDISTGSRDVVVAVSDSGVYLPHEDLANQIWTNPGEIAGNGVDDDGNGFVDDVHGWDFVGGDNDPLDEHKHGTHVSGIIGAEGDNGVGVAGVNWRVRIMPVRFLDKNGSGSTTGGIDTILYATKNGARIVNASWGGGAFDSALLDAIEYAFAHGTLFIAAAGNDSDDADVTPHYPSAYKTMGLISVASSQGAGSLSSFSNYGQTSTDLVAPGSDILSTVLGGAYAKLSGTSMATPMVSGIGALILSKRPDLSSKDLKNAILNAVVPRDSYAGKIATSGDASAKLALQQLTGGFQVWPSRITVELGETYSFTAFDGSGAVRWSVSDPSVASIGADGVLHPLKEGDLQVTARDDLDRVASTAWVKVRKATPAPKPPGVGFPGCNGREGRVPLTYASAPAEFTGSILSLCLPFGSGWLVTRRRKGQRPAK